MEYRQLGRSGLLVSALSMGTMTFGGAGKFAQVGSVQVDEAREQIARCLDAGVNLLDTADVYSAGISKEIVGAAIKGMRDRLLIGTKVRFPMGDGPNDKGLSRHHIIEACDASLRRLGVDHIDLYQLHQWDGITPLDETMAALDSLVTAGKVRYIGASNFSAWHLMKSLGISDHRGFPRLVSQQIYYSLQAREAEYELVPTAIDQGLGILVWSPLAGGLLSGKYRRGSEAPTGSRALTQWHGPPVHDEEALYSVVEVLLEIAAAYGVTAAQVALAYLLRKPGVTSLIVGARTTEQLSGNLHAVDLVLDDESFQKLDAVSRPRLIYPYWHQAAMASDRLSPADLAPIGPHL